eukprot:07388.XXX_221989_222177_1 [CDS] Oithona nana genome sequencing.
MFYIHGKINCNLQLVKYHHRSRSRQIGCSSSACSVAVALPQGKMAIACLDVTSEGRMYKNVS